MLTCIRCGATLHSDDTDSRQEWYEESLHCPECKLEYNHRVEFKTQSHLIASDILYVIIDGKEIDTDKLKEDHFEWLEQHK